MNNLLRFDLDTDVGALNGMIDESHSTGRIVLLAFRKTMSRIEESVEHFCCGVNCLLHGKHVNGFGHNRFHINPVVQNPMLPISLLGGIQKA